VGFRLKPDEPVATEVKRIIARQFERAVTELRSIGNPRSDAAVHRARRRVKKIRAALRLVRSALGGTFGPLDKRLRRSAQLLAPVADGQGVVEALDRLAEKYRDDFASAALASFRAGLLEREMRADRQAKVHRVLQTVSTILREERTQVNGWRLKRAGFQPIGEGLELTCRRARQAMAAATTHPTAENFHVWRRRVKDHWFQVRLIESRCGNRLVAYERRLEALDDCLGEYHNFALMRTILSAEMTVSRDETARRLRIIRRYQGELRRQARALGARIYNEKPRHFVRRVHALWRLANVLRHVPS
jgi:CHAD domain-containing protein